MRITLLFFLIIFLFGLADAQITTVENYNYNLSTQYGDVNADGNIDEVYQSGEKLIIRTKVNGEYTTLQNYIIPFLFKNFALANVDEDPFLEMYFVVNDWLYLVQNETGKLGQRSTIRGKIDGRIFQNVFAADFDGDGDQDPVVHIDKGNIFWMERLEDGFNSDDVRIVMNYGGVEGGSFGTFCDYDQDGDMDALLYNVYHGVYIVLNPGEGNFTGEGTRMSSVWNPLTYKVHDVDQDGFPEIIQTYRTSNDGKNGSGSIRWNPYGPGKGKGGYLGEFYHPGAIDVEDYNNDGYLDVFIADRESIEVFTNEGDTNFVRTNLWGTSFHDFPSNYPRSLICDDLDDDGNLEWIYTNYNPNYSKRINSLYTKGDVVETGCQNETVYGLQCHTDGLELMSQEALGQFVEENPDCKNVRGDLVIGPQMKDLTGLSQLQVIEGSVLIMNNDSLESLQGLENIRFIGGSLIVDSTTLLQDLSGLTGLTTVKGDVILDHNQSLQNVDGLEGLKVVEGRLEIAANPSLVQISDLRNLVEVGPIYIGRRGVGGNDNLESLDGLQNFTVIRALEIFDNSKLITLEGLTALGRCSPGNFIIESNDALISFEGMDNFRFVNDTFLIANNNSLRNFEGLRDMWGSHFLMVEGNDELENFVGFDDISFIRRSLCIVGNEKLKSLYGLENLEEIRYELEVRDNPALISMWGLRNVTNFGFGLTVSNNDGLTSLSGLENINHTDIEKILITQSANLSVCAIESICSSISNADTVDISSNAYGCNTESQIEDRCLSTDVSSTESAKTIQLYPNPTQNALYINPEGLYNAMFRIVNQMGQIVREGRIENELMAANLVTGIYFVSVTINNTISVQKVIVE